MKVIILAAGQGQRLGLNLPKSIIKLSEKCTILDYQLKNLEKITSINNIVLVVGFKKDLITKNCKGPMFIVNDHYATTNTARSLLFALENIEIDDVLWLNGDIIFDAGIIELIKKSKANFICVNRNRVGEEEVKYCLDNEGYIYRISKLLVSGIGEAIGINFIKKEDLPCFIASLRQCEDMDYFEKAIEIAIVQGVKFNPLYTNNRFCIEIDFKQDLHIAREFIRNLRM